MKNKITYLFLLVFLISGCSSKDVDDKNVKATSYPKSEEILKSTLDVFFKTYKNDGSDKAVDFIFAASGASPEQLSELKGRLAKLTVIAGNYEGYESITQQRIGESLVYYSFLVKHDIQPIRFIFIFYKAKDKWRIYKFKFDDEADTELEEAGKLYFVK
ncbi:hypothetical protein SRABI27_02315 [Pedobacter sp. Bi27]|uniref:hypothetical protein n=1 Tax=Pedobacter sp. Bi27 TaxID=2822351 RepID=UPI001D21681B|nr:hypothetical protein [Pedobacter sp. Bi27]CAH0224611.1 hypothetical protein SRABI27_02315 [Pedobacter sp. Bi27]